MVQVRLLTSRVNNGKSEPYGSIIDVPEEEAARLEITNQATRVDPVNAPPEPVPEAVPDPVPDPIPEPPRWSPSPGKW